MDSRLAQTASGTALRRPPEVNERVDPQPKWYLRLAASSVEPIVLSLLTVVALVPRILLAMQLDAVTDEVIYIQGGKIYLPLLRHLSIGASGWMYNYEHPPFVKLLIGLSITINTTVGHPLTELLAARLPSIFFGTLLVVALYWLTKSLFGRGIALAAALCLAFSPWLTYFSALAYLDITMTALVTIAYLLLWPAIRKPWLYPLAALFVGLGVASKYTAALAIPGMVLFTAYYFLAVRPGLPEAQRPGVPWLWWIAAIALTPLTFLALDPAIWPNPLRLLLHSFRFEWEHSVNGHLTFIAGQYALHVPHWSIIYIVAAKMSAFVTLPALFFVVFALVQLARVHLRHTSAAETEVARMAFVLIWVLAILGMFSLLNIVVGTHYHLPLAPPVALAGACGIVTLFRLLSAFLARRNRAEKAEVSKTGEFRVPTRSYTASGLWSFALLLLFMAGPHLFGLMTVYAAEGYTSELFQSENTVLQVAYPGYREPIQWIATTNSSSARLGLAALPGTLHDGVAWFSYNRDLPTRLSLTEAHPDDHSFPYSYLVWPMHLIQRGYTIPKGWHIIHSVMGRNTVYCYVLAPDVV